MVIENQIPKTETVYELKNEAPSFEEFMKTYESDDKVNYDDLTFSDISDKGKGHGPCASSECSHHSNLRFRLKIKIVNEKLFGNNFNEEIVITSLGDAYSFLLTLNNNNYGYGSLGDLNRKKLGVHLSLAIIKHRDEGQDVDGWISVRETPGFLGWGENGGADVYCSYDY